MIRYAIGLLLCALVLLCACREKEDSAAGDGEHALTSDSAGADEAADGAESGEQPDNSSPEQEGGSQPAKEQQSAADSPAARRRIRALEQLTGSGGHYDLQEAVALIDEGVAEKDPYSIMYKAVIERYHLKHEDYELPADFKETSLNLIDGYAAAGDPEARYLLARYMYTFRYPNTALTVFRMTRESADAGFEFAPGFLGYLYTTTLQEGPHFEDAHEWLRRAADDGQADAMYQLGYLYGQPDWDKRSVEEAYRWFERSAERGYPFAYWALGWSSESGSGTAQDYGRAVEWYEKGVAAGNSESMYSLAQLYLQGLGVEKNEAEARRLLEQSAAAGEQRAKDQLAKLGSAG